MNVLYVSDDAYAMLLGVSLTSLYIANTNIFNLDVYIVDDGIRKENKSKLFNTAERFKRQLHFIDKPDMHVLIGCNPDTLRWGDNIFCRLYAATLFSERPTVEKVLYLDCDTIVCKELSELWNTDLSDYLCAAGLECMGNAHKRLIGLKPSDPYFNSGVILINVCAWRKWHIENLCGNFIRIYNKRLEYPDEGVLNGISKGKIKVLAPEYNLTSLKCTFTYNELKCYRKSIVMYRREEYKEALENPAIIHYTSNFMIRRPWIQGNIYGHFYEKKFLQMKNISEWKKEPMWPDKTSLMAQLMRKCASIWRKPIIWICGIVYTYGKPLGKILRWKTQSFMEGIRYE